MTTVLVMGTGSAGSPLCGVALIYAADGEIAKHASGDPPVPGWTIIGVSGPTSTTPPTKKRIVSCIMRALPIAAVGGSVTGTLPVSHALVISSMMTVNVAPSTHIGLSPLVTSVRTPSGEKTLSCNGSPSPTAPGGTSSITGSAIHIVGLGPSAGP